MKRLVFAWLLVAVCAALVAAGNYTRYHDSYDLSAVVTCDSAGDSTTGSGSIYIGSVKGYSALTARFIMSDAIESDTSADLGDLDSCWFQLYSLKYEDAVLIDSGSGAGLPCTLDVAVLRAVGDTLLADGLRLDWQVYDSLGDALNGATGTYPISYDVYLK